MHRWFFKSVLLIVAIIFFGLFTKAAGPVLPASDEGFLRRQAQRIVASAALTPGQCVGKWCNSTSYRIHVPSGNMGYTAFWVRDAVMMLGGDLISPAEVKGWIRLISGTLVGPKDWQVRPGVVVPAYAVPDHINLNGKPSFYPGNYKTGSKQGGNPFGKYPPLDDDFYFVSAVYYYWKMTNSTSLFNSMVKTSFNEIRLSKLCERVYRVPPVDPSSGLVVAGDIETENAKDWGFCDGESKSGKLLFPSVLKFVAANQLAELFAAIGQRAKAKQYWDDAARIKHAIPLTFYHATPIPGEGWLHSATGVGNQPDVWGSAFAIWSGAVDEPVAQNVAWALVRAYREKTAVRKGCVRQILTTDPTNKGYWQHAVCAQGEYQNGGYWGTPTGWYISAISRVDRQAAEEMAKDYIQFLRNNLRPDGIAQAWEWFADDGKNANPLYVATVVLPYLSMEEAGLLSASIPTHSLAARKPRASKPD